MYAESGQDLVYLSLLCERLTVYTCIDTYTWVYIEWSVYIYLFKMGGEGVLTRDEIQDIINIANDIAEHTRLGNTQYHTNIYVKDNLETASPF